MGDKPTTQPGCDEKLVSSCYVLELHRTENSGGNVVVVSIIAITIIIDGYNDNGNNINNMPLILLFLVIIF